MIELEFSLPLPVNTVWDYLTLNKHLAKWWGKGVTLECKCGGSFLEPWTDAKGKTHVTLGRVTAIEDNVRLQIDWQNSSWPKPTRVEFLLSKTADGTKVYLQHSGWDIFDDEERQKKVDEHRIGWQMLMDSFKNYCLK